MVDLRSGHTWAHAGFTPRAPDKSPAPGALRVAGAAILAELSRNLHARARPGHGRISYDGPVCFADDSVTHPVHVDACRIGFVDHYPTAPGAAPLAGDVSGARVVRLASAHVRNL